MTSSVIIDLAYIGNMTLSELYKLKRQIESGAGNKELLPDIERLIAQEQQVEIDPDQTASEIREFLKEYAIPNADYDPEYDDESGKFGSPDANILFCAQQLLEKDGGLPKDFSVNSSWESGGYSPYSDPVGRETHNKIVAKCNQLIKRI